MQSRTFYCDVQAVSIMTSSTRVAIAGITGKLGLLIAKYLLEFSPSVKIVGYCRSSSKVLATLSSDPRILLVEGANDDLTCQSVICCYFGSNDLMLDGQKLLIEACEAEKVPRYIASDYVSTCSTVLNTITNNHRVWTIAT